MPDQFETGNIRWLFNREYYNHLTVNGYPDRKKIDFSYVPLLHIPELERSNEQKNRLKTIHKINSAVLEQKAKWLCEKKWKNYKHLANDILLPNAQLLAPQEQTFRAIVKDPGLLFGTGLTHESGHEGEFKLGFYFDCTTGLVVIPGHAIKGMVRSFFPLLSSNYKEERYLHIYSLIKNKPMGQLPLSTLIKKEVEALEKELFEGFSSSTQKPISVYAKDIFHEAFLVNSIHTNDYFLGRDAITPHNDEPLRNPTPLPFLKLLANTELQFQFHFKDGCIPSKEKFRIVSTLIREFGIGAKTNVGYGQFQNAN